MDAQDVFLLGGSSNNGGGDEARPVPAALPSGTADARCVMSFGMGVESQAIVERWIHEPDTRPFSDWEQLIVVTAQVGEEHKCDTIANVERRTLPMLRALGVRFVELARRGHLEADGI